jgi:DNA-directed RNA polymerase
LPSDRPQDIYRVVAEKTMEYVRKDLGKKKYADLWAKFGVDRSTMKRVVMTLPYGATKYSSRGYIQQWVEEQISKGKEDIFGKNLFHACRYLTDLAWKAIAETVIAAREAMDWLQKAARIAAKQGLPIYLTTPAGMPVLQAYPKLKMHRVETMLGGRVTINVGMPTKDLDKSKQASGISPNFIHSMDATHLFMTVNRAVKSGISSFATVHDSFGTHAADSPALARCLREAFVDLYENNTPLEDLRDELEHLLPDDEELPPLPKKGSLDLHQVLESVYFFA